MSEINNNYIELVLPVLPLRGIVGFPAVQMNIEIARPSSLKAFTAAATLHDAKMLLVAQKELHIENPTEDDMYKTGVLAEIKHVVKNPQGTLTVIFEGISRAKVAKFDLSQEFMIAYATARKTQRKVAVTEEIDLLMREIKTTINEIKDIHPTFNDDMNMAAQAIAAPDYFADFAASSALIDYKNKQAVLEAVNVKTRLEKLLVALEEEAMLLRCERDIQLQVREKIDRNQKDYFLREQIKAIQAELGEDEDDEIREYEEKIEAKNMPEEVKAKLFKELSKLAKTPFGAAESTVLRSYLDTCLDFPFGVKTNEPVSVAEARKILDEDHDGLEKVKERILEFVAIKQFSPEVKNQIICLVGPPGVGKTSVAASIAKALKRSYARVSLGGMHDEAEIRGHRKTYVGAMPGRIVTALINAKVENPVIVLDEICPTTSAEILPLPCLRCLTLSRTSSSAITLWRSRSIFRTCFSSLRQTAIPLFPCPCLTEWRSSSFPPTPTPKSFRSQRTTSFPSSLSATE